MQLAAVAVLVTCGIALGLLYEFGIIEANCALAMSIGGAIGMVELLGRYRAAPIRALLTWAGLFYVLINVAASWAAYDLLGAFETFKTAVAKDLTQGLAAGFGSLVAMRSSVFKVRVGDADVGIGPAAILDTLLLIADRGVDRREAVARAQDVTALVAHHQNPLAIAKMLTTYSLALMQNVDDKTGKDLADAVKTIMSDGEIPDTIKMDIVALRLGVIVGPDVLEAAAAAIAARLQMPTPPTGLIRSAPPPVADLQAEIAQGRAG